MLHVDAPLNLAITQYFRFCFYIVLSFFYLQEQHLIFRRKYEAFSPVVVPHNSLGIVTGEG